MDNSNKPAFKERKPMSIGFKCLNIIALFGILPMAALCFSLALPLAPFVVLKYVAVSNSTVETVLKKKIESYDDKIKSYERFSTHSGNNYKSEQFDADVKYCTALKEAYISLLSRKSSVELENRYHHKSTMKDYVFKLDKASALAKLQNEMNDAKKNMLMRCVIEDTVTINPLH